MVATTTAAPVSGDTVLSVNEVAARLKVHRQKVNELARSGEIMASKGSHGHYVYLESAVTEYEQKHKPIGSGEACRQVGLVRWRFNKLADSFNVPYKRGRHGRLYDPWVIEDFIAQLAEVEQLRRAVISRSSQLLTRREVALLLRVSPKTVSNMERGGGLAHVNSRVRCARFPAYAVYYYIREHPQYRRVLSPIRLTVTTP